MRLSSGASDEALGVGDDDDEVACGVPEDSGGGEELLATSGGGDDEALASCNRKRNRKRAGTACPPRSAGLKRICRAASVAIASMSARMPSTTSTSVTAPVASTVIRRTTDAFAGASVGAVTSGALNNRGG